MVFRPRGDLLVGSVSAWWEGRVAERASGLQIGPGFRDREGGLGAERGISCGCFECLVQGQGSGEGELDVNRARDLEGGSVVSGPRGEFFCRCCECLVQRQGSREGEWVANRTRGLEGGRVVSGPRGKFLVGAMTTWYEGRAAERANGLRIGQGFRDKEGGLGAERGSTCGLCECLVRG